MRKVLVSSIRGISLRTAYAARCEWSTLHTFTPRRTTVFVGLAHAGNQERLVHCDFLVPSGPRSGHDGERCWEVRWLIPELLILHALDDGLVYLWVCGNVPTLP